MNILLKQYNTGRWIGAARQLFSSTQFYLAFVNFGMIAALAFEGGIGDQLKVWFPWLTFGLYLLFFVIGFLFLALFEWKIVFPSNVSLSNWLNYEHNSPIRKDFERVLALLKQLTPENLEETRVYKEKVLAEYLVSELKRQGDPVASFSDENTTPYPEMAHDLLEIVRTLDRGEDVKEVSG